MISHIYLPCYIKKCMLANLSKAHCQLAWRVQPLSKIYPRISDASVFLERRTFLLLSSCHLSLPKTMCPIDNHALSFSFSFSLSSYYIFCTGFQHLGKCCGCSWLYRFMLRVLSFDRALYYSAYSKIVRFYFAYASCGTIEICFWLLVNCL